VRNSASVCEFIQTEEQWNYWTAGAVGLVTRLQAA
jgi:hypothetical protein